MSKKSSITKNKPPKRGNLTKAIHSNMKRIRNMGGKGGKAKRT